MRNHDTYGVQFTTVRPSSIQPTDNLTMEGYWKLPALADDDLAGKGDFDCEVNVGGESLTLKP
jgi:hypothetical protein